MATTTQIAASVRAHSPIALWHLLSLDAPTVAVLWTCFVARACHIRLPIAAPSAMFLAVWILYAADRLLDTRRLDAPYGRRSTPGELEERHLFHHRHRRSFRIGIALAAAVLAAILPRLNTEAIHFYLVEGALLIGWFLLLHSSNNTRQLPKELAVGVFFASAVFIPTLARQHLDLLAFLPSIVLLASLCTLNCLFIHAWEANPPASAQVVSNRSSRIWLHLPLLATLLILASTACPFFGHAKLWPVATACGLSSVILLTLHFSRFHLSRVHLRAAADLALLTPLLLLPFLR